MEEARENVNFDWKNFEFALLMERIPINLWNLIVHGLYFFKRQRF